MDDKSTTADWLDVAAHAHREVAVVSARLERAVQEARRRGASWAEVAAATGVSRQAARQRWGSRELV